MIVCLIYLAVAQILGCSAKDLVDQLFSHAAEQMSAPRFVLGRQKSAGDF